MSPRFFNEIEDWDLRKNTWYSNSQISKFDSYDLNGDGRNDLLCDDVWLRLSEMFLNYAEALAHLERVPEAVMYLNQIKVANNLEQTQSFITREELLAEIYRQRRIELWGDGLRRFDVLRLQQAVERSDDGVNCLPYSLPANSEALIYPIPMNEFYFNKAYSWNRDQLEISKADAMYGLLSTVIYPGVYDMNVVPQMALPADLGTALTLKVQCFSKSDFVLADQRTYEMQDSDFLRSGYYSYADVKLSNLKPVSDYLIVTCLYKGSTLLANDSVYTQTGSMVETEQRLFDETRVGLSCKVSRSMTDSTAFWGGVVLAVRDSLENYYVVDSLYIDNPASSPVRMIFSELTPNARYYFRGFAELNGRIVNESSWKEARTLPRIKEFIYPVTVISQTDTTILRAYTNWNDLVLADYPVKGSRLMLTSAGISYKVNRTPDDWESVLNVSGKFYVSNTDFFGELSIGVVNEGGISEYRYLGFDRCYDSPEDVNHDGVIDEKDLESLISNIVPTDTTTVTPPAEGEPSVIENIVNMTFSVNNESVPNTDTLSVATGHSEVGVSPDYQLKIYTDIPLAGFDIVVYGWKDDYKQYLNDIPGFTLVVYKIEEETHIMGYSPSLIFLEPGTHVIADFTPLYAASSQFKTPASVNVSADVLKSIFIDSYNRQTEKLPLYAIDSRCDEPALKLVVRGSEIVIYGLDEAARIDVYDVRGECVISLVGKSLPVDSLGKGVYLIRVGEQTLKFVKCK